VSKNYSEEELYQLPFRDESLELEERVKDLLSRLTLEEKFKLCSGRLMWHTKPIKRLGVKSFTMYDGPHGVRPDTTGEKKSTYNGRTFEYQTEDPHLNKILAVATVKGIQSQKIAACVKHFICNNQETNRFTVSSEVSERALQEIYLPAFKATVQEADAWSFMTCYNKVNGIYGSENYNLLKERLMENWGFRGFTVSDWLATNYTTTEGCVNAGLSLEMPTSKKYSKGNLKKAFQEGKFSEETLNDNIKRLLRVMFLVGLFDDKSTLPSGNRNTLEHQSIARKIAENGIVLLKNKDDLLPLNINELKKLAIVGPNANYKLGGGDILSGGGSSVNYPPYEITPLEGLKQKCRDSVEIIETPSKADVTILFAGLNHEHGMDAEGEDKSSFELPLEQIELIKRTVKQNPNTIVVLINGSPIAMNGWIDSVPSVIEAWYGGMEVGKAIANVLFGDVNPSGKLPLTFPKKLSDSPAHKSERTFPGVEEKVFYDEGIYVGYRYFDKEQIEPLFPFGYGLSYTTFNYENLKLNKEKFSKNDTVTVSVDIVNTGNRSGAEIIQLYVQDIESSTDRPPKELKQFEKVKLEPNERKTVKLNLKFGDFSFYDDSTHSWVVEPGTFNILLGSSSRDIHLQKEIEYFE
jgi:beta-glucosidase